jgi:hypothetical protein
MVWEVGLTEIEKSELGGITSRVRASVWVTVALLEERGQRHVRHTTDSTEYLLGGLLAFDLVLGPLAELPGFVMAHGCA